MIPAPPPPRWRAGGRPGPRAAGDRTSRQRDRADWDCRGDRGSATLELAILGPALLLLFALVIAAGRISISSGAIEAAARDAARQASIARDPAAARDQARAAAVDTLTEQGLRCAPLTVRIDTTGFTSPVGTPAQVGAQLTCVVSLSDLGLLGMPGSKTLRAGFASPLDSYRERR